MPDLTGFSHIGLSVPDLDAGARFWTEVMGFRLVWDQPEIKLLVHPGSLLPIGLQDHGGAVTGAFDHTRPGLDHVALAVNGPDDLTSWADHLDAQGVEHAGVQESDIGHHLNLRAPGNIAVELFVLKPEVVEAMAPLLA
jgi:glyoxylase I family protein